MISLKDIEDAARIIRSSTLRTPLVRSAMLSKTFGADIYLKLENLQNTGSFKIRGAACKILRCRQDIKPGGVITASAGNHAQGVALAASLAGFSSTIVMPHWTSISKQEATQGYGGKLVIFGRTIQESLKKARELSDDKTFVHPFDDKDVIAGQGTVALEILSELPDADMIVVPVGGGGLVSGISAAAKSIRPQIRIVGVESEACPSAYEAMGRKKIHRVPSASSIADGINVREIGTIPFDMMSRYVDECVLVKESDIAAAVLMLLERKKTLAEGAGALPPAALMSGSLSVGENQKVVLVISGGNVDSPMLGRIINHGLMKNGRIFHLEIRLEDRPGALAKLLTQLGGLDVNVLDISHERHEKRLPLNVSRIHMVLEARGFGHIETIKSALAKAGYQTE
ncbi:MAG: threonine ammonia-lyase [Desulfobacterales bacterium]